MITKDSVCWPTVELAINDRLADIRIDLETAPTDKVPSLQAEIRALRWLLQQAEPPLMPPLTSLDA